jgi:hypothetical protein
MSGHVFISYSRTDLLYVQRLAAYLAAAGLTMWWDYQLDPGDPFGRQIQDALEACAAVVPVLTPEAVASEWVGREISFALAQRKPIFPLTLIPCMAPIELAGVQSESVVGGQLPGARFVERLQAVASGVSARPAAVIAPPAPASSPVWYSTESAPEPNHLGKVALVLGILSVAFCCLGGGIVFGIPAVIAGGFGMRRGKKGAAVYRGQALGGVGLGVAGLILTIVFFVLFLSFPVWFGSLLVPRN